jgi:hypothetical protein
MIFVYSLAVFGLILPLMDTMDFKRCTMFLLRHESTVACRAGEPGN